MGKVEFVCLTFHNLIFSNEKYLCIKPMIFISPDRVDRIVEAPWLWLS